MKNAGKNNFNSCLYCTYKIRHMHIDSFVISKVEMSLLGYSHAFVHQDVFTLHTFSLTLQGIPSG